jgi:hypothetical protein
VIRDGKEKTISVTVDELDLEAENTVSRAEPDDKDVNPVRNPPDSASLSRTSRPTSHGDCVSRGARAVR